MAETKAGRSHQRKLGQFMTPALLAERIVADLPLRSDSRVLEPSFGDGAFILPLVRRLVALKGGATRPAFESVMRDNLWGVELDPVLYQRTLRSLENEFGPLPQGHSLVCADFFTVEYFNSFFHVIVGNPPFGGSFDSKLEDGLDRLYGFWKGVKLKKETYSFFIARSLDWLAPFGSLSFVASDTFLTIKTMEGLRRKLADLCTVRVTTLSTFSDETKQPTLVLSANKDGPSPVITVNNRLITREVVEQTGNFSWGIDETTAKYFTGPTLGEVIVGTGGMTIGRNEFFVRKIQDGTIEEPFSFEYFHAPVTLEDEIAKARLHKLSDKQRMVILEKERTGITRRDVAVIARSHPIKVCLPDKDYRFYNMAASGVVYQKPTHAIFWRDDGDAVKTFKKNGNWYLRGIGGAPFFGREGLTWQLISPRLNIRFLPAGYILDSGAPCAFLRPGIHRNELWFVLGWCLTTEATRILKTVINHTRNIQGKDVERLPYPFWVPPHVKQDIIRFVSTMVDEALAGRHIDRRAPEIAKLDTMFAFPAVTIADAA